MLTAAIYTTFVFIISHFIDYMTTHKAMMWAVDEFDICLTVDERIPLELNGVTRDKKVFQQDKIAKKLLLTTMQRERERKET